MTCRISSYDMVNRCMFINLKPHNQFKIFIFTGCHFAPIWHVHRCHGLLRNRVQRRHSPLASRRCLRRQRRRSSCRRHGSRIHPLQDAGAMPQSCLPSLRVLQPACQVKTQFLMFSLIPWIIAFFFSVFGNPF